MNSLYRGAASLLDRIIIRPSLKRRTHKLDPLVRSALAIDLADRLPLDDLTEIEQELQQAKAALTTASEKEVFLGQRCRHYRKVLDERAQALKDEQIANRDDDNSDNNDDDAESSSPPDSSDLEQRLEAWERDEDALQKIVETHKEILVQCETMRRTIDRLERKRVQIFKMQNECQEFLEAAHESTVVPETELSRLTTRLEEGRFEVEDQPMETVEAQDAVDEVQDVDDGEEEVTGKDDDANVTAKAVAS